MAQELAEPLTPENQMKTAGIAEMDWPLLDRGALDFCKAGISICRFIPKY
jgi:hypothetical protein